MTKELKEILASISTSAITEYLKEDRHRAFICWSVGDVTGTAKALGHEMDEESAIKIIKSVDRNADATLGITWETFQNKVESWIENKS